MNTTLNDTCQQLASNFSDEQSALISALQALKEKHPDGWRGTARQLFDELVSCAPGSGNLPPNEVHLGRSLNGMNDALVSLGINPGRIRKQVNGKVEKLWIFEWSEICCKVTSGVTVQQDQVTVQEDQVTVQEDQVTVQEDQVTVQEVAGCTVTSPETCTVTPEVTVQQDPGCTVNPKVTVQNEPICTVTPEVTVQEMVSCTVKSPVTVQQNDSCTVTSGASCTVTPEVTVQDGDTRDDNHGTKRAGKIKIPDQSQILPLIRLPYASARPATRDEQEPLKFSDEIPDVKAYYRSLLDVDIFAVADAVMPTRITNRTPTRLECDCPNHASISHTSFHISKSTQQWYCFGCGIGGDALHLIEFVRFGHVTKAVRGQMTPSHRDARDQLAELRGLPKMSAIGKSSRELADAELRQALEDDVLSCLTDMAQFFHEDLISHPEQLEAFQRQYQIDLDTIKALKIGYARVHSTKTPDGVILNDPVGQMIARGHSITSQLLTGVVRRQQSSTNILPFFLNRYTFPYWRRGKVIYMIGRRTEWTPQDRFEMAKYKKLPIIDPSSVGDPFESGACANDAKKNDDAPSEAPVISHDHLWNEDCLTGAHNFVVFAEGITDAISAMEHGLPVVSPVTTRVKKDDIDRLVRRLRHIDRVYLTPDVELSQAGLSGAVATSQWLLDAGKEPRIVILPRTAAQRAALKKIESRWPIHEGMDSKEITACKNAMTPEDQAEFSQLAAACKQDLNSYFLTHTADQFHALLQHAVSHMGLIIKPRLDAIAAGDTSCLNDPFFLDAMNSAEKHDSALYAEVMTKCSKFKTELKKTLKSAKAEKKTETSQTREREADTKTVRELLFSSTLVIPDPIGDLTLPHPFTIDAKTQSIIYDKVGELVSEKIIVYPDLIFVSQ